MNQQERHQNRKLINTWVGNCKGTIVRIRKAPGNSPWQYGLYGMHRYHAWFVVSFGSTTCQWTLDPAGHPGLWTVYSRYGSLLILTRRGRKYYAAGNTYRLPRRRPRLICCVLCNCDIIVSYRVAVSVASIGIMEMVVHNPSCCC